jgi:hypothetical protein
LISVQTARKSLSGKNRPQVYFETTADKKVVWTPVRVPGKYMVSVVVKIEFVYHKYFKYLLGTIVTTKEFWQRIFSPEQGPNRTFPELRPRGIFDLHPKQYLSAKFEESS